MKLFNGKRRKAAWLLIISILLTFVPPGEYNLFAAHAVTVGTNGTGNIDVTSISYVKKHTVTDVTEGVLQVFGSNLTGVNVLFDVSGEFKALGVRSTESDSGFIKYTLSKTDAEKFSGRIRIGSSNISVVPGDYPVIQGVDNQVVNKDNLDKVKLTGSNMDRIGTAGITATYGRGGSTKTLTPLGLPEIHNASELTIRPPLDTLLGLQDIVISEAKTSSTASGSDVDGIVTTTQYTYSSAFRVIKNLGLANLAISPNAAAKGEYVSVTATSFPASTGYQVYFLGAGEDYSTTNKSPSVVLSGDRTRLTVQVPNNTTIPLGTKTVKVVDTSSGEIIGESTVPGVFNLIESTSKPVISDIAPSTGTDSGSPVNIKGRYLLYPKLSDLTTPVDVTANTATLDIEKKKLTITYDATNFLYQGNAVTSATRELSVIVGATATFEEDALSAPKYQMSSGDDLLYIRTASVTDAETDPLKDVVVSITTKIVSGGQQYVYNQTATVTDGYTYIPSSIKPTITKVSPPLIHVDGNKNMQENTLISIEGSNFMVNKWTDDSGVTHVNYPVVVIQKDTTLGTDGLALMFDKNGNPSNNNGRISYNTTGTIRILMNGASEVPVDMVVLDSNNRIVDGTVGNDVGSRIVLYLPKLAQIDAAASRNLKVLNPRRNSDILGSETIALDALTFVSEPSPPVISSVSPSIVTLAGGEDVTITGSTSIQDGAKVYIDGKEVSGVTRSGQAGGSNVLLKFKAPAGRLGKTQIAVMNPEGGIAVRDFYYVQSFNQDPTITTVAPDKGTEGTLVVVAGNNYFKPDPSVSTETGMDAYRLLGTRGLIDGVEVNTYNTGSYGEIVFNPYVATAGNEILQIVTDAQGDKQAQAADYAQSIIMKGANSGQYYVLDTQLDGTIRLTNGQSNAYTLRLNPAETGFLADKDGGTTTTPTVSIAGITINGELLSMKTAYAVNGSNVITGNKTRVISKNQVAITVPRLVTAGIKSVAVENPDTKRATKANAFTYYDSPFPQPSINTITPNVGSVSGGYFITINGTGFEPGSLVYLDGLLVPAADTSVNAAGTVITIKVPKYSRTLSDYNTDRITVPVVVVNLNAGTSSVPKGFTYINPSKEPTLTKVQLSTGSTNGGDVVELEGTNFNYFEPFKERDGVAGYSAGDTYTDINGNGTWDNLGGLSGGNPADALLEATAFPNAATYMFYSQYYATAVLPKVYFGNTQAKIVGYGSGKITVVTPAASAGTVDVYVVNNDSGISNKLKYTYQASSPKITYMNPTQGARVGQENRDIYGSAFAQAYIPGYYGDGVGADSAYQAQMSKVEGLVRFAEITNRKIALGQPNDGKIGGGEQVSVTLDGGLSMLYNGAANTITVNLQENGKTYTRLFSGYDDKKLLIPAGMLKTAGGEYYVPNNYNYSSAAYNTDTHYELFLVEVDATAGRFYVERGYAPRVKYDNSTHLNLDTPSYYTIGAVSATVFNPDGGYASTTYTYKNPASKPIIRLVKPQTLMDTGTEWMVEASVKGGITIEIKGYDFRNGVKVYIDKKPMEVVDITTDTTTVAGETLDVIIARVPAGATTDIGLKYALLVENTDGAIASSVDTKTLSDADKKPIYFIYRNPLSDPVITAITPSATSIAGGNEITITGTDFRSGASVIIGSKGGIPVAPSSIDPRGTWLKFTTPVGLLTLGVKDIQVINSDFGTGIKASGLNIISYPKVTSYTAADTGSTVEWLSVEGGGKIKISGSGFATGAKVVFGGTRGVITDTTAAAVYGLWKDDKFYGITDGVLATAVEFVNENTLIVTAPAVTKEKDFTITVINADTGISDGDTTVKFNVPVPAAPVNLKADVIDNKYIRIYNYTSSNFDYYEIFYYVGEMSDSDLLSRKYQDFIYLGTATTEPHRITKLDDLRYIRSDSKLKLVLKAVNKYGPSDWSNIVHLDRDALRNVLTGLGEEDFDGNLDVPQWEAYKTVTTAQEAIITLSKTDLGSGLSLDLTKPEYSKVNQYLVTVPETVVNSKTSVIRLNTPGAMLSFNTAVLNTEAFYKISTYDKLETYANVRLEKKNTQYAGQMLSKIPRSMKAVSQVYRVESTIRNNTSLTQATAFSGAIDLGLRAEAGLTAGLNASKFKVYRYEPTLGQWQVVTTVGASQTGLIYGKINKPGDYVILGER